MSLGKETFNLTKKDYSATLSRIIDNHRVNALLIGEPREFVLRSCKLSTTWFKMASDPEVKVYLRNVDLAAGRKVKLISLEKGPVKQPVSKSKLVDSLYPPKKIKTSASPEEKHYNMVKAAMRSGVSEQLKQFREEATLPTVCYLSGKQLRRGHRIDVDHVGLSFSEIADSFMKMQELTYCDISLIGPPSSKKFRDSTLWEQWKTYHKNKAEFSLVCASANRSKGSSGYHTPESLYGSFAKSDPEDLALDF